VGSFWSPTPRAAADSVTVFVGSELSQLDPHYAISYADHLAVNALHLGLTTYNEYGNLIPGLAESWIISGDSLTYTFTLKPGASWSDGRAITGDDFVAGIRRALDPDRPTPFAAKLFVIADAEAFQTESMAQGRSLGVVAPDRRTVVFTLGRRDVDFLHILSHPVAKPTPALDPDAVATGRITSGPYQLTAQQGSRVDLVPREEGPTLRLEPADSVDQVWIDSEESGAFVTAALPIVSTPRAGRRGADIRRDGGDALYAYAVNTTRTPLNTLEARHALSMAIHRPEVMRRNPVAGASPATQFVSPSAMTYARPYRTPFASLTLEEREAVAAALLSEHDYGVDNRFTVKLRVPSGDIHTEIASVVAEMWARAGIDTEIVTAPLHEHWQALADGDFDVAFVSWPGRRDTPRSSLEPLSRAGGPWNWPRYDFPDFSERLERAAESRKDEVRAGQYREAEKALIEDQTLLALFFYQPLALVSSSVGGWQTNAAGLHPLGALSVISTTQKPSLSRPALPKAAPSIGTDQ
jgi:oligopeptide transport system substrate-binding protein